MFEILHDRDIYNLRELYDKEEPADSWEQYQRRAQKNHTIKQVYKRLLVTKSNNTFTKVQLSLECLLTELQQEVEGG